MINVRDSVFNLLNTLQGVGVYHSSVDPFKADKYPIINIQTERVTRKQIADNFVFRNSCDLLVVVCVATTSLDFDAQLDALVYSIETKILTDSVWNMSYESVPEIVTEYGYAQAGEQDLAVAKMRWSVKYTEVFDPNLTHIFDTAGVIIKDHPDVETIIHPIY